MNIHNDDDNIHPQHICNRCVSSKMKILAARKTKYHRNEDELMEEGESAEDAFNRHIEHKKNSHTARGGGQKKS